MMVKNNLGWLCEGDPEQFAIAMRKVDSGDIDLKFIGMNGRKRVEQKFSFTAFTDSLDEFVLDCAALNLTEGSREEGGTTSSGHAHPRNRATERVCVEDAW